MVNFFHVVLTVVGAFLFMYCPVHICFVSQEHENLSGLYKMYNTLYN